MEKIKDNDKSISPVEGWKEKEDKWKEKIVQREEVVELQ